MRTALPAGKPQKKMITHVEIDTDEEKEVIWWPEKLKEEIKQDWSESARKDVGFELGRVQQGLDPDHYRPMPSIGTGVREIKVQDEDKSQYRLIYTAKFREGIYAFHIITKKTTEQTSPADIQIAKKRLREIINHRKENKLDEAAKK